MATDLYLIGGIVALFYVSAGVWLITSNRSITFDISRQVVSFSTHHLLFERKTKIIPFMEIAAVYLDYEEQIYHGLATVYWPYERIRRKWLIFLVLNNEQTITLTNHQMAHPPDQGPVLSKQTAAWEKLATKICAVTGKLLIRTPSVPGRVPHTFIGVIDQIVQRRLVSLPPTDRLTERSIRLRSHPTGNLEIVLDGTVYRQVSDIADPDVRNLIQEAVDEWQDLYGSSTTAILK
jgi:hypothetical protein